MKLDKNVVLAVVVGLVIFHFVKGFLPNESFDENTGDLVSPMEKAVRTLAA